MTKVSEAESAAEQTRRIHSTSFVFDACIPPMGFWREPAIEIQAITDGGVSGANVTCAQPKHGFRRAVETIRQLGKVAEQFPDKVRICRSARELEAASGDGLLGLVIHFQEPKPIEENLDYVGTFYELGLRVLQLTYDAQGWLGTGCAERHDTGLSYFGLQVVEECNRLGILIDVSHCSYQTAWDAIKHSKDPIAITHTGAYALCQATGRNKPDDMIRSVAEGGGVIGVSWFPPQLKRASGSHKTVPTSIEDVLDHVDHMVQLVGPEHVGIGSDLSNLHARTLELPAHSSLRWYRPLRPDVFGDGPTDRLEPYPTGLDTHAKAWNLTAGLLRRGYREREVRSILGGNWLRLVRQVWRA